MAKLDAIAFTLQLRLQRLDALQDERLDRMHASPNRGIEAGHVAVDAHA